MALCSKPLKRKKMAEGGPVGKDGTSRFPKEALGTGALRQAAESLLGRRRRLDEAIEEATGEPKQEKKPAPEQGYKKGGKVKKRG